LAGRKIQDAATKSNMKKVTLELGGKSPAIVCEDANIDVALQGYVCPSQEVLSLSDSHTVALKDFSCCLVRSALVSLKPCAYTHLTS
jgi:hypothetical protein